MELLKRQCLTESGMNEDRSETMSRLFHKVASFASDYSGACSVFHDMGGMIVYCDAGACFGNSMAFDEPRRAISKRIFSLVLREKDVVMGIDRLAKQKIVAAHKLVGGSFIVLLGTPVSTVIGTDLDGFAKEIEKEVHVPVFGVTTTGLSVYDDGQKKAYETIMKQEIQQVKEECPDVHIIGATPLDGWDLNQKEMFTSLLKDNGFEQPAFWGDKDTLRDAGHVAESKLNIAVSVSAIEIVKMLYRKYGTPYKVGFPVGKSALRKWQNEGFSDIATDRKTISYRRALIVGEQIASNMLREMLEEEYEFEQIDVVSFFGFFDEFARERDRGRISEGEFLKLLDEREPYDLIIGDQFFTRAVPYTAKKYISIPNLAISGLAFVDQSPILFGELGSKYFQMMLAGEDEA